MMTSKQHQSVNGSTLTVGMIGSGSWATAIVKILSDNQNPKSVLWWIRNSETAEHIKKFGHNPNYLSAVHFNLPKENIRTDIVEIIQESDIIILNTPAAYLKNALKDVPLDAFSNKIVVSAIKGIVPDENLIVGDYLKSHYQMPVDQIVVIGGPCHAEEVAQERLSYLTIASQSKENAVKVADLINTRYINTIVSDDIFGTEYAAVLKNIYAVAGGICHGIGFGDNFQAVLVSNAIREMELFMNKIHPIHRNIMESAYLGDLLVTAYSQFSRNRTFGNMIGKGYSINSAQLEMNMVAEGYYASSCIQAICKRQNIQLPICNAVYRILYENKSAKEEMSELAQYLN